MKYRKQSKLERIASTARTVISAGVLTLVLSNTTSEPCPVKASVIPEERIVGRAHQLLADFPAFYQIPGAMDVYKIENPEANHLLIVVAKKHDRGNLPIGRKYKRELEKIHSNLYLIHPYLIDHFKLSGIAGDGLTPKTILEFEKEVLSGIKTQGLYNIMQDMRREGSRFPRKMRKNYDKGNQYWEQRFKINALERLASEGVRVFPGEASGPYIEAGIIMDRCSSGGVTYEEVIASNMKREFTMFDFASSRTVTDIELGAFHVNGGIDLEKSTIAHSMKEWNSRPENKYKQFCIAVIIPWGYDPGDMPIVNVAVLK